MGKYDHPGKLQVVISKLAAAIANTKAKVATANR
jgi:hypothetical protein